MYKQDECGIQSEVVYSLNHDAMVTFLCRTHRGVWLTHLGVGDLVQEFPTSLKKKKIPHGNTLTLGHLLRFGTNRYYRVHTPPVCRVNFHKMVR